jgi:hypothetical protein
MKRFLGALAALTALAVAVPARAGSITFTVGGATMPTQSPPIADSFTNAPGGATITVPDGGSLTTTLQGGTFTAGINLNGFHPFSVTETFTANTVSMTLTLAGSLNITNVADTLTFNLGAPVVLNLPSGQTLTVTQQALSTNATVTGSNPYTLTAHFALSAAAEVPELDPGSAASAVALLGLSMTMLNARRRRTA